MTKTRRVTSGTYPQEIEHLQGKTLVNFDVQEIEVEDGISYSYEQLLLQKDAPQELIEKEKAKRLEELKKEAKQKALSTLKVTTKNENTFDGNEASRNNMIASLQSMEILNKDTIEWKLADNTIATINRDELREALSLAIIRAGEIILE